LDYGSLRKRVQAPAPAAEENAAATFLELIAPPSSANIAECALEVASSSGARLRVELKDMAPAALAAILRDFAG
jgi:hypothetical protein